MADFLKITSLFSQKSIDFCIIFYHFHFEWQLIKINIEIKTSPIRLEDLYVYFKLRKMMIPLLFLFGRYLLDLLENVSKGLHARLHLKQMSADTQNRLTELHLLSIQDLKLKCEKVSSILNSPMILIILKMNVD